MNVKFNDKIIRSAHASKLSYFKTPPSNTHFSISKTITSPHTTAQTYINKTGDKSLIIAFKGSSTHHDILTFLDLKQTPFNFCNSSVLVHNGILRMFESIENDLSNYIFNPPKYNTYKYITFCGHSLGGSLAKFAAAYYGNISNHNINIACHTFGAPLIGNQEFIDWTNNNTNEIYDIINKNDVVPLLPLLPCLNYKDDTKNKIILNTTNTSSNILQEHDLDTYIKNITQIYEMSKYDIQKSNK